MYVLVRYDQQYVGAVYEQDCSGNPTCTYRSLTLLRTCVCVHVLR